MLTILLHSSKTMRRPDEQSDVSRQSPALLPEATNLARYLASLSPSQLQQAMKLSEPMAAKTHALIQAWRPAGSTLPAIDSFLGDIYSGLQVQSFTPEDRAYANDHLFILSGLYGVLRALDDIQPYRLEMGYRLPGNAHDASQSDITSLYKFWGDTIAQQLPKHQDIINLSAAEYTKTVFPYLRTIEGLDTVRIISPKFLTVSPKTGEPTFVTVHAKVARGAFARWLIQQRIENTGDLKKFAELGYKYDATLSTLDAPVFVAQTFQGIGLSVRLT